MALVLSRKRLGRGAVVGRLGSDGDVDALAGAWNAREVKRASERISSDGPTRLPEALRAIQAGKLPRRAGLTMVRHDHQYELTLHAESLTISGARLPAAEGDNDRARLEERISQIRHLLETLDLLYGAFCQLRLGADWGKEHAKMKKWLRGDEA